MYSPNSLSGTETASFWDYWSRLKNYVNELYDAGPRLKITYARVQKLRDSESNVLLKNSYSDQLMRLSEMYTTWEEIRDTLDEWMPTWKSMESSATSNVNGLGFLPLALPAWAIASLAAGGLAALTFVVTQGMSLLAETKQRESAINSILSAKGSGAVTAAEATKMISSLNKPSGVLDNFASSMGDSIGDSVPYLIGAAALILVGPELFKKWR